MAKITFVYPDYENLGIQYLMSVCVRDGHEVELVYYRAEDSYIGTRVKRVPFRQIAERIAQTRPDVAAFSCVTDNYQYQLKCARELKEIAPDIIIAFGGVHVTAVPDRVLQNEQVDCVGIGECERSFSRFLSEGKLDGAFILPEKPVDGIVYKKNGRLIGEFREGSLDDIDELPFPHKTPFFDVLKHTVEEYKIMSSRGCPYSCSYCFNAHSRRLGGKKLIRQRSVDNVIDELLVAMSEYPLKYVLFTDDCFTTNKRWLREFCRRYKKEIGLPFACLANPHFIDRGVAEALGEGGCLNVQVGVQSLSEELCSGVLHRKPNSEEAVHAIKELRRSGIMVQVDHMLGIPGDTLEFQEEALRFYNRCRPDSITVYWLSYYPKTPIVEIARDRGILTESDVDNIEEGKRLTGGDMLRCGSMKDPGPYYGVWVLLNYLPLLPGWLLNLLVRSRIYRMFKIKSFFVAVAVPRVIQTILSRNDFRGRSHIVRFVEKIFLHKFKRSG